VIHSVEIKGLRGIREGKLTDLTPLVVLVGPNGSGKSTVLEAILIGASPFTGDAIGRAVRRHQGVQRGSRWLLWKAGSNDPSQITITADPQMVRTCKLELDRTRTENQPGIICRLDDGSGERRLGVSFAAGNTYGFYLEGAQSKLLNGVQEVRLVEPHAYDAQAPLHQLYTHAVEQGRRKEAREIISEVVPGIADIEILTEGESPIVHLVFDDYSVPAALAGDGIQSLLRLSLELTARPGAVVLIEEPELHQHPGALRQSARAILAAVHRGIQVVLTTHSLELIDALLAAASKEDLEKLGVYRLQLQAGLPKSHRLSGSEVAFARGQIEDDLR
jgi:predicted ATPase